MHEPTEKPKQLGTFDGLGGLSYLKVAQLKTELGHGGAGLSEQVQVLVWKVVPHGHVIVLVHSHLQLFLLKVCPAGQVVLGSFTHVHVLVLKISPHPQVWAAPQPHEHVAGLNVWGALQEGKAEQPQVALTAEVPHWQAAWLMQTQSHRLVSNLWMVDTHRAAGLATHWQVLESKTEPQPQEMTEAHTHLQELVSNRWPLGQVWRAVHPQVALTAEVPQTHCCCCRHWQSQVCVLKKCRLDTHLAAGLATHEQV